MDEKRKAPVESSSSFRNLLFYGFFGELQRLSSKENNASKRNNQNSSCDMDSAIFVFL